MRPTRHTANTHHSRCHRNRSGEIEKYGRIMHQAGLKGKTLTFIEAKVKELLACKNYTYKEDEITKKVELEKRCAKPLRAPPRG